MVTGNKIEKVRGRVVQIIDDRNKKGDYLSLYPGYYNVYIEREDVPLLKWRNILKRNIFAFKHRNEKISWRVIMSCQGIRRNRILYN